MIRSTVCRHIVRDWLAAVALALSVSSAWSAVALNKSFNPISMPAYSASTLTITLLNTGSSPATAAALTDNLPPGMTVASVPNVVNGCGGNVTATAGATSLALANGAIPAATPAPNIEPGQCSISVDVTSATAGSVINTIPVGGLVTSQGRNTQAASATLSVNSLAAVTGSKAFNPTVVHGGGTSRLTITLNNPNGIALTGVAFTDTLPAPLVVALPSNLSTTCGPTPGAPGSAVAGSNTVGLNNATLPANSSCAVIVDVTPSVPTTYQRASVTNTVAASAITSTQGTSNAAAFSASIQVQKGARLAKAFAAKPVVHGDNSSFTITVENYNTTALSPIGFTDPVPIGLNNLSIVSNSCGGSASVTGSTVSLTGGSLPAAPTGAGAASCAVVVGYTADRPNNAAGTAIAAAVTNTATGTGTLGTGQDSITLNPTPGNITATKAFSGGPYAQGGTATLTITFNNAAAQPATITSFTDNLTTMGTGYTVGGPASTTCGGTVAASGTAITMVAGSGNSIPANSSCTITVPVAISPTALTGTRTNTLAAGGLRTDRGYNGAAATAAISVTNGLSVAKSFSPTTIISGLQSATMTITLTRAAGAPALTNLAFTDTFPTAPYAMLVAANPALNNNCGGTATATPGTGVLTVTGGALPIPPAGIGSNSSCTITVAVSAAASASGSAVNTIAANTISNTPGVRHAAASATLTARRAVPALAKGFSPTIGQLNFDSMMTVRILNNNADAVALTGVGLTDNLPTGMVVAPTPSASFGGTGCTGGAITATAGTSVVSITNANIAAGSVCTLQVRVRATAAGNLINSLPAGAIVSTQGVTNLNPVSATLSSSGQADLYVTKTDGVNSVNAGESVTYTVVAGNNGPNPVIGASVTDAEPTNASFSSWSCAASAGASCPTPNSGSGAISGLVSLPVNGTATFTVTANVPASATGTLVNTARIDVPGTVVDPTPTNNSATDTDTIVANSALALTKTDNSSTYTPGGTGTYVVVVGNGGPSNATNVSVADNLPAGITLTGTPTCTASGSASCGSVSGTSGGSSFTATGASIPAGSSHTLSYSVPVRFASSMAGASVTNTVTATPAGGAAVSASDTNTRQTIANLALTKTASQPTDGTYLAGQPLNYTLTLANNGPSDAVGVRLADTVPASVNVSAWACAASGVGADCDSAATGTAASGSTNAIALNNIVLPAGTSVAVAITGTAAWTATGDIVNSATAQLPAGTSCGTPPCDKTAGATSTNAGTPRLTLSKTATPTAFAVGRTGVYSLNVGNDDPASTAATTGTLTVTDTLPTGVTASATPSGSGWDCSASTTTTVQCTSTALLIPGASAPVITVPVNIAANATSPVRNAARTSGGGDTTCPATGNAAARCLAAVETPVNAPGFTIDKALQDPNLVVGVPNQYVITVTNDGQAATLAGGSVSDVIPASLGIDSLPSGCTSTGGQGFSCVVPADLPHGGQVSYTIGVTPLATSSGQAASNTATVGGGGDPGCPADSRCADTVTATITAPQLLLEKTVNPTTLVVGQSANYTLTVTNQGSAATIAAVTVSDTLPGGLTIGTLPSGCTRSGQVLSCSVASLGVGSSASFVISVTPQNALNGQSVTNAAGATGGGDPGCASGTAQASLPARCQAAVTAPVSAPQLTLTKTSSGTFAVGVPASYTLQVQNTGSAATFGNITVIDVVPAGLTLGTLPLGCTAAGQQVTCTITTSLAAGASTSFTLPVTPTAAAAPRVSNTATALGGGDPVCPDADNCKSTVVTQVNTPQLQITQSANLPWTIGMGGAGVTLNLTNVGAAATTGPVTVRSTLPAGITPGWSGTQTFNGWACTASGQETSCVATPDLAASGGSASFTLPVTVTAPTATGAVILASVGGGGDPLNGGTTPAPGAACTALDAAVPGHCASLDLGVPASATVSVSKSLAAGVTTPLNAGQTVSYLLTATNTGGTTVALYTVNEVVPAGTRFASVSDGSTGASTNCAAEAAAGTLCSVSFASVPAGGSATVTVTFTVANPLPAGLGQIVNAITAPAACTGAACEPPPTPAGCTTNSCTPPVACTAGDALCVSTPLAGRGPGGAPTPVPTTSRAALLLLVTWLMLAAAWRRRVAAR